MADDLKPKEEDLDEICGVRKPLKAAKVKLKDCCVVVFNKKHYNKLKPLLNDYDKAWIGRGETVYNNEEPFDDDDLGDNVNYSNLSYDSAGQF